MNRISSHISSIKNKGLVEFIRKIRLLNIMIFEITWFVIFLPISIFLLLIIRLASPFLVIRLERLISWRIGHYAGNTDMYLCEKKSGINFSSSRTFDIWFDRTKPCNLQLRLMLRRVINIYPRWLVQPVHILNNWLPGGSKHIIPETACNDRDILNLTNNLCSSSNFKLTTEEEIRGRSELEKLGVKNQSKFVCLIVRDSAYLKEQKKKNFTGVDWTYHDFRDSEIKTYELAAEELASNGYYVIRMGTKVNTEIKSNNPMIIDYAVNAMRSDFLDIYLGAKCEFCITTSTGYDAIPRLFRRPVVQVNIPSVEHFYSFLPNSLAIFRKVKDTNTGQYLSLKSIIDSGVGRYDSSDIHKENCIELIENSPEEIKDVVTEMMLRVNGKWHDNWYDSQARSSVESIYSKSKLNGKILSRFGTAFLKDNLYLLEYNND